MTTTNVVKAATGNIDATAMAAVIRNEVIDVVKQTVAHYFIWMNAVFGVVGFALGCIVTLIIL